MHDAKCFLDSKFNMKDMGEANEILGIKILRYKKKKNALHYHNHIMWRKKLKRFEYFDMLPISTLYDAKVH